MPPRSGPFTCLLDSVVGSRQGLVGVFGGLVQGGPVRDRMRGRSTDEECPNGKASFRGALGPCYGPSTSTRMGRGSCTATTGE